MESYKGLMIGEKAPHFEAGTTFGTIRFPEDYRGKWVVFFSHPGDFTPVCTTEIMTFASMQEAFAAQNAALLGLSIDSNPSHIAWTRAMEHYEWDGIRGPKIGFPIVADDFGTVARLYGMLMPSASATRTVRSVFIIDPEGTVRAILVYPLTTGRNTQEILRLLLALQAYDATQHPTPCNWKPGDPQLLPAPGTAADAAKRLAAQGDAFSCLDWYICFTGGENANRPEMNAPNGMQAENRADMAGMQPENRAEPRRMPPVNLPGTKPMQMPDLPDPKRMQPKNRPEPDRMPVPPVMMPPDTQAEILNYMKRDPGGEDGKEAGEGAVLRAFPARPAADPPRAESASRPQTPPARPRGRAERMFTLQELAGYNGKAGRPAYGAVNGVVYDLGPIMNVQAHMGLKAGTDLTRDFNMCHMGMSYLLNSLPIVGRLR
jgi:peroxiredoxin (alkyl hydroperoxide reductase subunit C)